MARHSIKWPFICCYFLRVSQAGVRPPSTCTSEAIIIKPIKIQTRQAPQNDCLNPGFVKDKHTVGGKMPRNGLKMGNCYCHFILRVWLEFQLKLNLLKQNDYNVNHCTVTKKTTRIRTIFMFLDPNQRKFSKFYNELRTAEN